ncbi:MAG: hypothetical protein JJE52_03485 [Acidimicrobiia bacterium]|nr:hypothetical protein [Acidimicrobiia bacterium]
MNRDTLFMRTAARIGDLGSPLYDEERRRDVWNEASAVGFQIMLWSATTGTANGTTPSTLKPIPA